MDGLAVGVGVHMGDCVGVYVGMGLVMYKLRGPSSTHKSVHENKAVEL